MDTITWAESGLRGTPHSIPWSLWHDGVLLQVLDQETEIPFEGNKQMILDHDLRIAIQTAI